MKNFFILDANSIIHRTFHALPSLTNSKNQPINALYGLSNILLKLIEEEKIDYFVACFDRPEPTFRKEIFHAYKAQRPKAPQELVFQIKEAHNLLEKFNIKFFEKPGFEADDLIGFFVNKFKNLSEIKIFIFTGDLDTLQLVEDDKVLVKTFKKGISELVIYNEAKIFERFKLKPKQLIDFKALVGDVSDNIFGIKGVGEKTAIKILEKYQNIDNLLNLSEKDVKGDSVLTKILMNKDQLRLNLNLVKIKTDFDLDENIDLKNLLFLKPQKEVLIDYFQEIGFPSLVKRLTKNEKIFKKEETKNLDLLFDLKKDEKFLVLDEESIILNQEKLKDETYVKIAYSFYDLLKKYDLEIKPPFFDLKIAAWLINPDEKELDLNYLLKKYLNTFDKTKENLVKLYFYLKEKLSIYDLNYIFNEIELPLIEVLIYLEKQGILVDKSQLIKLKNKIEQNLEVLTKTIYDLAKESFNLNSPKQISYILFEKLKLQPLKRRKMKTGSLKTEEEVLESIKDKHPIVNLILDYRNDAKILNTYIKPILEMLDESGRLKTNFLQTNTSTGRLVSLRPNLQNLPQNQKWANEFKKVFIAEKGYTLVSFDYSQLELRILAYETQDENLIKAFLNDYDIHKLTASKIFKVPLEKIDEKMRKIGKTLNFGMIYGMGVNAFMTQSRLTKKEAQEIINQYFKNFSKIKIWQQNILEQAKNQGMIRNKNGRLRWLENILSENEYLRKESERIAINMPIQSLGADIIKLAMIKIYYWLKNKRLFNEVKMILSIHDELLFEIKDDKLNEVIAEIKKIMENVYKLDSINLKVEINKGKTWAEI